MSYILEALKKSEQERKQGDVPNIQTVHMPRPTHPETRTWPYLVIVLLLVSLAFVIGWMQPWNTPVVIERQQEDSVVIASQPEPTPVGKKRVAQQAVQVPPQPKVEAEVASAVQRAIVAQAPSTEKGVPSLDIGTVPHLSEMPQLVQQAIPEMSFAGHVYSSNAEQRSVIINGHSMSEGDTVINGLVVEQITSDGIVFSYRDQLFRMEILQDWSFDY